MALITFLVISQDVHVVMLLWMKEWMFSKKKKKTYVIVKTMFLYNGFKVRNMYIYGVNRS